MLPGQSELAQGKYARAEPIIPSSLDRAEHGLVLRTALWRLGFGALSARARYVTRLLLVLQLRFGELPPDHTSYSVKRSWYGTVSDYAPP